MRVLSLFLSLSLIAMSVPAQAVVPKTDNAVFERLSEQEMAAIIGGSSVGQVEINAPAHNVDLSGDGSVYINVSYRNVEGAADLVVFVANGDGQEVEVARWRNVTGSATVTAYLPSSAVYYGSVPLVAELIAPEGDPYDPCADGTSTIYGRATIYVSGNGT